MAHISIEAGRSKLNVERLPDGRMRVGDEVFAVEDLGGGAWRAVSQGTAASLWAAGPRDNPWVYYAGVVYRPRVGQAPATGQHRDDLASLSAPMPATVRAVFVTKGQPVVRGETMMILEAMKMELPLRAPHDGVVKDVRCRPGELVQPGTPLLEIQ
jgi:3-methylcrotonyl-CoA carboxylase alpha subunit